MATTAKGGQDVDAIDRELTQRLGLKPSPLPSREPAREPARAAGRVVGHSSPTPSEVVGQDEAGAALGDSSQPVIGEILDAIPVAGSEAYARVDERPVHPVGRGGVAPSQANSGHGNVISSLLAIPGEARGRLKSKQQILDQLRDNYEEVLRVVRKVDGQLDQHQRRAERMLEVAEHTAHGRLPEIREETRKVGDAIDRLSAGLARGQDRIEQGVATQVAAIERVQGLLTQLVEADRSLGESLVEFRRTAIGMASATERLGSALAGLQDRSQRRDEQIAEALDRSNKTMATVLILSIVSAATAIAMVVLAVV